VERSHIYTTSTNCRTDHYAILARKLVKAGRVGLALVVRITSLVGMVEDIEVIVINVVASKDIGDEFQDRGFSDTSLSNKKNSVWRFRPVLDNPVLKRLGVAGKDDQKYCVANAVVTYFIGWVLSSSSSSKVFSGELAAS